MWKRDVSLEKKEAVYRGSLSSSNTPDESQSQTETLNNAAFAKIPRAAIFSIIHTPDACVGFNDGRTVLISPNARAGNVT